MGAMGASAAGVLPWFILVVFAIDAGGFDKGRMLPAFYCFIVAEFLIAGVLTSVFLRNLAGVRLITMRQSTIIFGVSGIVAGGLFCVIPYEAGFALSIGLGYLLGNIIAWATMRSSGGEASSSEITLKIFDEKRPL